MAGNESDQQLMGVVLGAIEQLKEEVRDVRKHVDDKIDKLIDRWNERSAEFMTKELFEAEKEKLLLLVKNQQEQIDGLIKERNRLLGVIVTAVLLALLSLVIDASRTKDAIGIGMHSWTYTSFGVSHVRQLLLPHL
jgi:hypothetical protein